MASIGIRGAAGLLLAVAITSCGSNSTASTPAPQAIDQTELAFSDASSVPPVESVAEESTAVEDSENFLARTATPATYGSAGLRLHDLFANRIAGEIIAIEVTGNDGGQFEGSLFITQDGQVVRVGLGEDGGESQATADYVTWEIGSAGFQAVRDELHSMDMVADSLVSAPFDGAVRIYNSGTRVWFRTGPTSAGEFSSALPERFDEFLNMWDGLTTASWPSSAVPTQWTPHRILAKYLGERELDRHTAMWPLDTSPMDMPLYTVLRREWLCVEGDDAALVWDQLMSSTQPWNRTVEDSSGRLVQIDLVPMVPSYAGLFGAEPSSSLPDSCGTGDPRLELRTNPTLTLDSIRLNIVEARFADRTDSPSSEWLEAGPCPTLDQAINLTPIHLPDDNSGMIGCTDADDVDEYGPTPQGFGATTSDRLYHDLRASYVDFVEPRPETLGGFEGETVTYCVNSLDDERICSAAWVHQGLVIAVWGDADAESHLATLRDNFGEILHFLSSMEISVPKDE